MKCNRRKSWIITAGAVVLCAAAALVLFWGQLHNHKLLNVDGDLYKYTKETEIMGDSGGVAGKIISSVESGETPVENAQSNFGCIGSPYTRDYGDGTIRVFMDDEEYHVFEKIKDADA